MYINYYVSRINDFRNLYCLHQKSIMNILNITIYFILQFNRKVAALDIQKIISKEILYFDF